MPKPSFAYQRKIDDQAIQADALQKHVLESFDTLYGQLTNKRFLFKLTKKIHGIYLFGPVGRGKTMMMDLFLNSLPKKIITQRYHYHAFMRMIHRELKNIQGIKNPLTMIAKKLKKDMHVLFLDEFFVLDMANAMILGDLFKALFKEKLIILTTSNCAPDELYQDGLFRERFLPAIDAIKKHLLVLSLESDKDYRIRKNLQDYRFIYPDDKQSQEMLHKIFQHLTDKTMVSFMPIECLGREIKIIARNDHVIWLDFNQICAVPRSQNDYLALAEIYDTFILSHVPIFHAKNEDAGLYFTMLIDVLYDHRKQIILSAEASCDKLFPKSGALALGFERTYSRLMEMQSQPLSI
jgi:cell division protein ZapE